MTPEEANKTKKTSEEFAKKIKELLGHELVNDIIYSEVLDHRDMERRRKEIRPIFGNYLSETGFGLRSEADEVLNGYLEKGNKMILLKMKRNGVEEIIGFTTMLVDPVAKKARLNDSYLKKEFRGRGIGNRMNAKRAMVARMEGVPASNIIPGGSTTKDGAKLQKARPKVFGRIFGVDQKQFDQMKPKSEEKSSQTSITNFEKERLERKRIADAKRAERVKKMMKRGSRGMRR